MARCGVDIARDGQVVQSREKVLENDYEYTKGLFWYDFICSREVTPENLTSVSDTSVPPILHPYLIFGT